MNTYHYTLQMDAQKHLHLYQEGQEVPITNLLTQCGSHRVWAFDAPMGTGKTTLIKHLCEQMGTRDVVNSPTFAIVNVYDLPNREEVYHFDCYRLKDLREAQDFGAEEYLYSGNYCFIEWPEIIAPLLPEDTVHIQIRSLENSDRSITIQF